MKIPVVWFRDRLLCWDQTMVAAALQRSVRVPYDFDSRVSTVDSPPLDDDGAVVVVPARYFTPEDVNRTIAPLQWALVILTSDEESTFDPTKLHHPRALVWTMTPRTDRHAPSHRYLGEGWPPDTRETLATCTLEADARLLDWYFAGQITHDRRRDCARALQECANGSKIETNGFAKGITRDAYLRQLASAKVAPCPSGPATPDSFRLYEALEAGCLPVVDTHAPGGPHGYWQLLFGGEPSFPTVAEWDEFPTLLPQLLEQWPRNANRAFGWWQRYKRDIDTSIAADLTWLTGDDGQESVDERITVLVPTSPIPAHPDTSITIETLASIRQQLPDAEIVVMCDGVRPEQADRADAYDEYLRRLLWWINVEERNVVPLVADEHQHQANLTRAALRMVRTPLVLFVEHDTPLVGQIDWPGCVRAILDGPANLIRFHHEASVLEPHRHLMLDDTPLDVGAVPMLRTVQWSQRPHLASAGFYRDLIDRWFRPESRTMIEDTMHGVVENAWREEGLAGWLRFRMWMYAPDGDIKRSTHLDGRGADPKFPMLP